MVEKGALSCGNPEKHIEKDISQACRVIINYISNDTLLQKAMLTELTVF